MALDAGNAACSTGLSKRIFDALVADSSAGFSGSPTTAQTNSVKALAHDIALGVVAEIAANAAVSITVPIDAFGAGIPASPVVLTGTVA